MRRKNYLKKRGFTLVEMLIVVIIVAILAAIAVPIYLKYVEGARAAEAQTAIAAIWTGEKVYYQKTGKYTRSIDDLDVDLDPSTTRKWKFEVIGDPPKTLQATSTEEMAGGASKQVVFDVETSKWSGYGSD